MPLGKFKPGLYFKFVKPTPPPSKAELVKIKSSLCMDANHPFPRCPSKDFKLVRKFESQGDFSHSGNRRAHICDICRCKRVAGKGTKHYGVGYCFWHDVDVGRKVAKTMAVALQQGYPLNPIKYQSDSEYIDAIRKMSEKAQGRLDMSEEIILLRSHLQEVEKLWKTDGAEKLTMSTKSGPMKMTDDIKIALLVKLAEAISKLSRDTFAITESDYLHVDTVKTWLWSIWQCVTRNIHKMITGELQPNDLEQAMQNEFKQIPFPKTGHRGKK